MVAKVAVIFYSVYGHTLTLAETAVKSATESGAEVQLYQIPETLSTEVLGKLGAAPRRDDIPTITTNDLVNYDGYIFVIPTRYGRAVAQFSHFFDATGGHWTKQSLSGKFASVITSTATQGGGQETTAFTTIPFFVHHGIIFVPLGYSVPTQLQLEEIKGGAPWGAGTLAAADGSRRPTPLELNEVSVQAKSFVTVVEQFKRGGERIAAQIVATVEVAPTAAVEHSQDATTSTAEDAGTSTAASASGAMPASANVEENPSDVKEGDSARPAPKKRNSMFKKIKKILHT